MNKKIVLFASLCLLVMAFTVSAQDNAEKFMGEWTLDVDKSELGERSNIESMTMKVSKTVLDGKTWLTITKTTKRAERQAGQRGLRGRMGRGRGGEIDGKNVETINYDLNGKESKSDVSRGRAAGKATAKIKYEKDGSMIIDQKTEFNSPRGSTEIKNIETWELAADGKTLTVLNELETPRGNRKSTMVFDNSTGVIKGSMYSSAEGNDPSSTVVEGTNRKIPKRINGGVINGKATSLPTPAYPADAQAAGIKGTVNVEVVVDKKGNVMSANAISGHPLLRAAAVKAARKAKFGQTTLSGHQVEVAGVLIYNFQ